MGLRLPLGQMTVLMGSEHARRQVMTALDESTGRCAGGHGSVPVQRLSSSSDEEVGPRLEAVEEARRGDASIVLVDRFTDGLSSTDRRAVLSAVRSRPARKPISTNVPQWAWSPLTVMAPAWQVDSAL